MKLSFTSNLFLSATVLLALTSLRAQANSGDRRSCRNHDLPGEFTFTARGDTLSSLGLPAPLTGAFASEGTASFDGTGHFALTATSSFNGVIQGPATVTGTYDVNPDCSYTSKASNGVTFQAVIVDQGQTIYILQTTPGVIISGTVRKRDLEANRGNQEDGQDDHRRENRACTATSFAGRYGFLADGFAGAPTIPGASFSPLAGVGTIDVSSNGTFSMMARHSVDGVLDPALLPLAGTYKLGSNCTVELTFDIGFHFTGVISAQEATFLETDPGTALTVVSKRL